MDGWMEGGRDVERDFRRQQPQPVFFTSLARPDIACKSSLSIFILGCLYALVVTLLAQPEHFGVANKSPAGRTQHPVALQGLWKRSTLDSMILSACLSDVCSYRDEFDRVRGRACVPWHCVAGYVLQ